MWGQILGMALRSDAVGAWFWTLNGVANIDWIASQLVKNGGGHEIVLEESENVEC